MNSVVSTTQRVHLIRFPEKAIASTFNYHWVISYFLYEMGYLNRKVLDGLVFGLSPTLK